MSRLQSNILILILSIVGMIAIIWWLRFDPSNNIQASLPGADNRGSDSIVEDVNIGEHYDIYSSDIPEFNEVWASFRGEDRDNIAETTFKLNSNFKEDKLPIAWRVDLGEGHAGAAIYKGQVFLLDYLEEERADMLRCFALDDGRELWRTGYDVKIKRNHGMSRTVPAVTEDFVLTIGPRCHVMCVDRKTGEFLWGIDIEKEYLNETPLWYTGQCPYIDGTTAIIATGGKALMIAVDCKSGEVLWEVPNPKNWQMSHASVMPYTLAGKKMYVYSAVGGVCGVSESGEVLFESDAWNHSVVAPSALCLPDGKIFLTAGYGAGSMVIRLKPNGNAFDVEVLDEFKPRDGLASEQQTPVFWNGHVFGILPKEGGTIRNQFVCVHPDNFREMVWTSGKEKRYGLGPYFMADNKFFLLNDDATLTILEPSTTGFKELNVVKLLDGHDAWAPLATADGYLILRDSKTMLCLNLNKS